MYFIHRSNRNDTVTRHTLTSEEGNSVSYTPLCKWERVCPFLISNTSSFRYIAVAEYVLLKQSCNVPADREQVK